ncbi:hypothetical protein BV898_14013 [Hypsibius exemplaris]|uniref:Uncharacterized protein n=1 Tax=Hypsibius exemplaris TaxID=2072580 RepID=A0A1W0W8Z1_HYPEX|nr:hypothetical protein BV898_14013 [Hypsibius exemplaris]
MVSSQVYVFILSIFVLSASCMPVELDIAREKRGTISKIVGGAVGGALIGAVVPGISWKQGAAAGAAAGGAYGLYTNSKGKKTDTSAVDTGSVSDTASKPSLWSRLTGR